ncbi:MAG: hypothetical protein IT359_10760 [Gemmatimonadaceae bacterium]|nr:hypothetical protein [Gemmatimonadaceae bacterium]
MVLVVFSLFVVSQPTRLRAQAPRTGCSYAECALRLQGGELIRGRDLVVGRMTLIGGMPRLTRLAVADDSAQAYARTFDRWYPRSRWVMLASSIAGGLALGIAMDHVDAPERGMVIGLGTSFLALGGTAWYLDRRATRALGSALYWHNAVLPRQAER